MLERDIEMETDKICAELDRQRVTGHFKIRGSDEEIGGPHDFPWKTKPIPGAVALRQSRGFALTSSKRKLCAGHVQSLLSSTSNDKHRKARAATLMEAKEADVKRG